MERSIYADDTRVSYNLLQGLNEGIRTPNKLLIYTIKEVSHDMPYLNPRERANIAVAGKASKHLTKDPPR